MYMENIKTIYISKKYEYCYIANLPMELKNQLFENLIEIRKDLNENELKSLWDESKNYRLDLIFESYNVEFI